MQQEKLRQNRCHSLKAHNYKTNGNLSGEEIPHAKPIRELNSSFVFFTIILLLIHCFLLLLIFFRALEKK